MSAYKESQTIITQNQTKLASIFPDSRYDAANKELREAQLAYAAAEDRLIKAKRVYEEISREWRKFYSLNQRDF